MVNNEINVLINKLQDLKKDLLSLNDNLKQNIGDLTLINTSNYIDTKVNNINTIIINLQKLIVQNISLHIKN